MHEPPIATTSQASSLPSSHSSTDRQTIDSPIPAPYQPVLTDTEPIAISADQSPDSTVIRPSPAPKLVPRSAITQGSLRRSSLLPQTIESYEGIGRSDSKRHSVRSRIPFRDSSKQDVQGLQTMMDFLSAEPRLARTSTLPTEAASPEGSKSTSSSSVNSNLSPNSQGNNDGIIKRRASLTPVASTSKKKSLSLLARSPSRPTDRGKKALAAAQSQVDSDCDIENEHDAAYRLATNRSRWPDAHVISPDDSSSNNLVTRVSPNGNSIHTSPRFFDKGKARVAIGDSYTPQIQLKVIPVTDLIIMFGSTQTSSNYSLSGKVVLRMKGDDCVGTYRPVRPTRVSSANYQRQDEYQSDSDVWHSAAMSASDSNSSFKTANSANEEESGKIHIRNLQIIFSGFALYGDRTGRLATTRLAHSQFELLPLEGTTIPYSMSSGQDYEIEFNLSVPGWLPSSLTSRFGGTFYCLEAKAEYQDIKSRRVYKGPLIPPRSGFFSGSTPSLSMYSTAYDSDTGVSFNEMHNEGGLPNGRMPSDDFVSSSALTAQGKGSWLSKTARQLQNKVARPSHSPTPGQSSSTLVTPTLNSKLDLKPIPPQKDRSAHVVDCGDGYSRVQSKAKTIVIGRCREVVPVPVARMAIVGPEGLPEGAHQDPPPTPRSSSADRYSRSRSSTITASRRAPSPPPVMPTTFGLPSDSAKIAASLPQLQPSQLRTPRTPRRGSSAIESTDSSIVQASPTQHNSPSTSTGRQSSRPHNSSVPMRHFMHQPMLHPPATAQVEGAEGGLPFSLTLTLPSYVTVDGPESDILTFAVQIDVGRSTSWSKVRELGGLRLRDMELQCIQTERHSSVASRTFCNSYPLPTDTKVPPLEIPIMETWRGHDTRRFPFQQEAAKLRAAYDRSLVDNHLELLRLGRAPLPTEQNVERVRTSIVGPPIGHKYRKTAKEDTIAGEGRSKGKKAEVANRANGESSSSNAATSAPATNSNGSASVNNKKNRRKSLTASQSAPSALLAPATNRNLAIETSPANSDREEQSSTSNSHQETFNATRRGGRGRRAYQSAIRGLSNLATAVLDISLDVDGTNGQLAIDGDGITQKKKGDEDTSQTAIYSFAGSDGHGVDLTRGRVRMAINLPLVSSDNVKAKASGSSRLVADFESPYIRVRHKLKVKLGFGFGDKPLGDEGDGNWGQALVMCVPVRFTDAAPREVREQFAPLPVAQIASSTSNSQFYANMPIAKNVGEHDAPLLPSYNQLFREDGSRLADEGEDLPKYPGPTTTATRITVAMPSTGSVTAASPQLNSGSSDHNVSSSDPHQGHPTSPIVADALFDNRITPSRVVDESVPIDQPVDVITRQQQVEFEEMELEEDQEGRITADRMNETVNLDDDDDLYEDFGEEEDALGIFSSSDQARSGAEENSQAEND